MWTEDIVYEKASSGGISIGRFTTDSLVELRVFEQAALVSHDTLSLRLYRVSEISFAHSREKVRVRISASGCKRRTCRVLRHEETLRRYSRWIVIIGAKLASPVVVISAKTGSNPQELTAAKSISSRFQGWRSGRSHINPAAIDLCRSDSNVERTTLSQVLSICRSAI